MFSQVKREQRGMPRGPSPHLWSCVSFVNMIADVGQVCLCRLCVTMGRETAGSHRREGAAHEKGLGTRERFSSLSPSFALRLPSCMHVLFRQQRPALVSSSSPHRRRIGCGISGIRCSGSCTSCNRGSSTSERARAAREDRLERRRALGAARAGRLLAFNEQ